MTTTIHTAVDPASAKARLMALLDDAAEKYSRPRSVTFTMTLVRDARRMRTFVVDVEGEIVCIDSLFLGTRAMRQAYRHEQGFAIAPSASPAIVVFDALVGVLGIDAARSITIREVR